MDFINGLLSLLSLGTPRRQTEAYRNNIAEIFAGQNSNNSRQTYYREAPIERVRSPYSYSTVQLQQVQGTQGNLYGAERTVRCNTEFNRSSQQRSVLTNRNTHPEPAKVIVKQPQLLGLYNDINMLSSTDHVKCISLSTCSYEFLNIASKFPPTLRILEVQKVFNPFMRKSFELTRQLKYDNMRPLQLYHGTKLRHVSSICRNNFDWRLSGTERGHRIGYGVNFTSNAVFAVEFCDRRTARKVMILADVLIKRHCVGYGDLIVPPEGFDTAIRVRQKHKSYVKFNDSEFFPSYVIYHLLSLNIYFELIFIFSECYYMFLSFIGIIF